MRKAIVSHYTGIVQNVIEIKEGVSYSLIPEFYLVDAEKDGSPGDTWNGTEFIKPPPAITKPSLSTHIATLVAVDPTKARPARIKRVWEGRNYFYDCFATQTVKDEFVAGKIAIGNYVLVHFDDIGEQIVTAKVWKSW